VAPLTPPRYITLAHTIMSPLQAGSTRRLGLRSTTTPSYDDPSKFGGSEALPVEQ